MRFENRDNFRPLSVFSIAYKLLWLFEQEHALGRRITWLNDRTLVFRINDKQRLPISNCRSKGPRYYRGFMRIDLPHYPDVTNPDSDDRIYSSDSPDIIAHETAHAIIDSIAPALYHSSYAQSKAIHEGIADFCAFVLATTMTKLRRRLLEKAGYELRNAADLVQIARQYGQQRLSDQKSFLRSLSNEAKLSEVDGTKPHKLSAVLSGLLLDVICDEYKAKIRDPETQRTRGKSPEFIASEALRVTIWIVRRMVFRALDYLPPGDIGFTCFVEAMLASDMRAYPKKSQARVREYLTVRAENRGVFNRTQFNIEPKKGTKRTIFEGVKLANLVKDNEALSEFILKNSGQLGIPSNAKVLKTRAYKSKKKYWRGQKNTLGRHEIIPELIIKVSWVDGSTPLDKTGNLDRKLYRLHGVTLVVDWKLKSTQFRLTSNSNPGKLTQVEKTLGLVCDSIFDEKLSETEVFY